jgi:hypothetical protein
VVRSAKLLGMKVTRSTAPARPQFFAPTTPHLRTMAKVHLHSLEEDQALQRNKHSHWKIFQTIERLAASPVSTDYSPEILSQVVAILRGWANAWSGVPAYQSFLNKKSLQHEIEECLPALHHLNEWRKVVVVSHLDRFVAIDVCGGKGCLAMLLQYVATHYWNKDGPGRPIMDHVILLEKAKCDEIDWYHLLHPTDGDLIPLVLWEDCNLHETDVLLTRIRRDVSYPIAATGIHLCKMLSPSMVSLVNLLGPNKCVYVCLAPCCMPRAVTKTAQRNILGKGRNKKSADPPKAAVERQPSFIHVAVFETQLEREDRMIRIQRRDAARRRKGRLSNLVSSNLIHEEESGGKLTVDGCFCCRSTSHQMQFCPLIRAMSDIERKNALQSARPSMTLTPCWNCGMAGHVQAECGNPRVETVVRNGDLVRSLIEPPQTLLDVTNILDSADPMRMYCDLLVGSIHCTLDPNEIPWSRRVWETVLVNAKAENQPTANWNSGRKAMYLVAYARSDTPGHVLQTRE